MCTLMSSQKSQMLCNIYCILQHLPRDICKAYLAVYVRTNGYDISKDVMVLHSLSVLRATVLFWGEYYLLSQV